MDNNELIKNLTRDSSTAVEQDYGQQILGDLKSEPFANSGEVPQTDIQAKVEELVGNDLATIRSMTGLGFLTREQGQTLMKQLIENAYNSITKQHEQEELPQKPTQEVSSDAFTEFANVKPDFFNRTGRDEVLKYLKECGVKLDKDELLQISQLVEAIENSAVDRYLKKLEYGKTLNDENTIAKQRLRANAQSSNAADTQRVFTRTQIGKMSGDEFLKNEAAIMSQLRRGLIN